MRIRNEYERMITSEQLARSGSEDGAQAALFCWASQSYALYPDLRWLFAVPNGGWRDPATANKLKATGVKAGVPDIFLPIRRAWFNGLWIELKRPKSVGKQAGRLSNEQRDWKEHLLLQRFGVYVAYGWEDARDMIIDYLRFK